MIVATYVKVCIIGGSIAGLECGIRLSDSCDVTIFEEHEEIGHPLKCAEGWVTFTGIKPYTDGRKLKNIAVYLLNEDMKVADSFEVDVDAFLIIDRPEMEKKMAGMAEKKGSEIVTGRKMTIEEASRKFDFIIDASGYPSQWCREFGGKKPYGFAMEAFFDDDYESAHFYFKKGLDGYFWVFPMKRGGCKVGVGVFSRYAGRLRGLFDAFLRSMGFGEPERITAAPLGCYPNLPLLRHHRVPVALVGDAAGLVDRGGGEGMTKAVISARILADCILSERVENYEKRYFDYMSPHYLAMSIIERMRKNWNLIKAFCTSGAVNVSVKLLERLYSREVTLQ